MGYMIAAEHIRKKYGGKTILQDTNIHVKQGAIYGLVGKNGSGKTTLLRILAGLINDYGGHVTVGKSGRRKGKVAAVIKDPSLFLNMSAVGNMQEQACLLGIHDHTIIEQALRLVGLGNCNCKPVKAFSLGMTQRLKLGMTLLEQPDILILDEPTNGLDPDGIAELRELLFDMNRSDGTTIIISSHILSELEHIATCFGILHDGKIVKEADIDDVTQEGLNLEQLYMQYTKGVYKS